MQEKIIEAALFISSKPLTIDELGNIAGIQSLGYVKEILEKLQKKYENSGIEIVSTEQGWTMQVRPEILPKVSHLTPHADLSEGCKRTLALIVYKEPVKQSEIIKIQGNKAYSYIKELKRRGFIRLEKEGHTKVIYLTKEFEKYFGEEKEKIKEKVRLMKEQEEKGGEVEVKEEEKKEIDYLRVDHELE